MRKRQNVPLSNTNDSRMGIVIKTSNVIRRKNIPADNSVTKGDTNDLTQSDISILSIGITLIVSLFVAFMKYRIERNKKHDKFNSKKQL